MRKTGHTLDTTYTWLLIFCRRLCGLIECGAWARAHLACGAGKKLAVDSTANEELTVDVFHVNSSRCVIGDFHYIDDQNDCGRIVDKICDDDIIVNIVKSSNNEAAAPSMKFPLSALSSVPPSPALLTTLSLALSTTLSTASSTGRKETMHVPSKEST
ncbi:hypothetical protein NDU88_003831 [Pleurodeles waltl]|uniref:Uncharacterized protein n=1 Tax=Pleurodeles waltl TaxID=8319 RepID=A0AAV7SH16_PLEWA|nr:hypothetical protein NDU88_003831 [Pleurodeles waltl]